MNDEDWGKELDVRLTAMVKAMSILDKEGLFAQNQSRRSILINVELMPEMVRFVETNYKNVKKLHFEPVLSSIDNDQAFYNVFH